MRFRGLRGSSWCDTARTMEDCDDGNKASGDGARPDVRTR
ncbi:MAG: hypothetical protein IPJ34_20885 [Myxococcales bacterium]|nr:hypothetical protein [Myxococcales bacterium]